MMRMTSRRFLGTAAGAILSFLVTQPPGLPSISSAHAAANSETYSQLNLLGDVFERLKREHVEKVDDAKLVEGAIKGMLESLDPHSRYMDEQAWRDMQVTTSGEFGGVGIEITTQDDLIQVTAPIDDTPAARAGIMSGDLITHVDDRSIRGAFAGAGLRRMKGPISTQVRLKVIRKGAEQPIDITLTREAIRVKSVRYRVDGDDIGYVRISTFGDQTTDELRKALAEIARHVPRGEARRLHRRPAQQSGRAARPGGLGVECVHDGAARSFRSAGAPPRTRNGLLRVAGI